MDSAVIREGFGDFARYAQNNNIPFYIVSGGVDFFIEPLVEKFGPFQASTVIELIFLVNK